MQSQEKGRNNRTKAGSLKVIKLINSKTHKRDEDDSRHECVESRVFITCRGEAEKRPDQESPPKA